MKAEGKWKLLFAQFFCTTEIALNKVHLKERGKKLKTKLNPNGNKKAATNSWVLHVPYVMGVSLHTTEAVLKPGQKNFILMLMLKAIITLYLALNPKQGGQAFELHTSAFRGTTQCPIKNIPNFSCSQKTWTFRSFYVFYHGSLVCLCSCPVENS